MATNKTKNQHINQVKKEMAMAAKYKKFGTWKKPNTDEKYMTYNPDSIKSFMLSRKSLAEVKEDLELIETMMDVLEITE